MVRYSAVSTAPLVRYAAVSTAPPRLPAAADRRGAPRSKVERSAPRTVTARGRQRERGTLFDAKPGALMARGVLMLWACEFHHRKETAKAMRLAGPQHQGGHGDARTCVGGMSSPFTSSARGGAP